jgi:anti-anti-sigma regulatory factor
MLRVVGRNDRTGKTVEIHDDLEQEALYELDRECSARSRLVVDLSNLRHLDTPGAVQLRELSLSGSKLVGASPSTFQRLNAMGSGSRVFSLSASLSQGAIS